MRVGFKTKPLTKCAYIISVIIKQFLIIWCGLKKRLFWILLASLFVYFGVFFDVRYIQYLEIPSYIEHLRSFIDKYGINLYVATISLVALSHAIFSLSKDEGKYKNLERVDLLDIYTWVFGSPPGKRYVLFNVIVLFTMLSFLLIGLYITFIMVFIINLMFLARAYVWHYIRSDLKPVNEYFYKYHLRPIKMAYKSAKYPRLFIDMMKNADEDARFSYLLEHNHFDLKIERLGMIIFLCMSYFEICWDKEELRDQRNKFIISYQSLIKRYGLLFKHLYNKNDDNIIFINTKQFKKACMRSKKTEVKFKNSYVRNNRKIWKFLKQWVFHLRNEVDVNANTQQTLEELFLNLKEDFCIICTNKPLMPKLRITMAMQIEEY